jgi:O-antigen/teichoic acid export membrane protein
LRAAERLKSLKLLVDLVVLSGGQLLSKVLGFVAFAYLARALGPTAYGSAEYVIGLATFCTMLVEFGLGPVAVRDISKDRERLPVLAANVPFARLGIVALSVPALLVAAHFSATPPPPLLVGLYALTLLFSPWKLEWLFQACEMMTSAAAAQVIRMGVFAIGAVLLVKSGADLAMVGWVELAAAALTTAYYLLVQHVGITPISFRFSFAEARALIREGASVGGSQMVSALNLFAPLFLVANLAGAEQTAWFGASHRVVASLSTFSLVYHFNLYPVLTRRIRGPQEALYGVVRASTRVVGWVGIGAALGLTLGARILLELAFGKKFSTAAPVFELLVWYLPATLLSGHGRWLLIAGSRQHFVFWAQLIGSITTVVVGVPLTLRYQAEGGAAGMVAGGLAVWAAAHVFARKHVGPLAGGLMTLLPAGVALAAFAVSKAWGASPWIAAPVLTLGYFVLAPLLDRRLLADLRLLANAKSDAAKPVTA